MNLNDLEEERVNRSKRDDFTSNHKNHHSHESTSQAPSPNPKEQPPIPRLSLSFFHQHQHLKSHSNPSSIDSSQNLLNFNSWGLTFPLPPPNSRHSLLANRRPISSQSDCTLSTADLFSDHTITPDSSFFHFHQPYFTERFPTTTTTTTTGITTTTTTTSDTHPHHHTTIIPHAPLSNTLYNPTSKLSTDPGCLQPKLRSVLMIHYPARRRIRASQHTQLSSSSGGIGESPLNPKLHLQKTSNSLLHNIRHSRNRSQSLRTSQQVEYTDHLSSPNNHTQAFASTTNSPHNDPSSLKPITNHLEHSNLHSFVASLGRAPISTSHDLSIKPSQVLHSSQSQPAFISSSHYESTPWSSHTSPVNQPGLLSTPFNHTHHQPSTAKFPHPVKAKQPKRSSSPRLVSTRARSHSNMGIIASDPQANPSFKHGHARSASAQHAHIPSQPESQAGSDALIPSQADSTYVRLRVLSFETLGGFYGKYADPKPRFVTTPISRPATSLGIKRPNDLMEELAIEAPSHPRKLTKSVTNPRISKSLEALKQRAAAAAQTERTHAQSAWDEIYQLRLERELWRAEAEASCNPGLFCTSVFPSSPADVLRRQRQNPHARRKPSAPIHMRSDHTPTPRSLPSRSFSFRNRAQSAPPPPDQPSSQPSAPNPRKSSLSPFSVLNLPPRRSSISQPLTVRSYLKRPSSSRSRTASRVEARVYESTAKPPLPSALSRTLRIDRALSPEVGRSHDGIFVCCPQPGIGRGRAHSNAARSHPEPTLADVIPQPLKGLRRSRSVPGLRRRRPATADNISPLLPTNAPHNISAKQLKHSPSYRLPSMESEPTAHSRAVGGEAPVPTDNSWFSNRSTEAFQSFFQRLPSSKSKLQTTNMQTSVAEETPQMTDLKQPVMHALSENLSDQSGEFEKPYQGLTLPSNSTFNAHSSLQSDSPCDPTLAPPGAKIPDDLTAHPGPVDLRDHNSTSSTSHNTVDAKLYSLPLVVPPPSESFNPLPPPPRRRNSTKNTPDSLSSKRSKSFKSGRSELALSSSSSGSRPAPRSHGPSFISTSPPALPNLADSSYEAPPLTPTRPTTATNPTRPSPIIITPNLSSALVSLERIRRLSSPDPPASGLGSESAFISPWRHSGRSSRTTSLITRGPMGIGSVSRTRPSSPRSSQASPLSTQLLSKNLMDSTRVNLDDDGGDNHKEVGVETENLQLPASPTTENHVTAPTQSTSVQPTSQSGESLLGLSGRHTRRRVRTMTELSGSSSQSESSHSLIDLDKYIDQADLFYQVPASPRRDLIKRYSEQITDRQRTSVRRPPMSPDRRSRLIDEVLSDYFHHSSSSSRNNSVVRRGSQEIDDQERPEGKDIAGSLAHVEAKLQSRIDGKTTKGSTGSRERESKSSRSISGTREGKSRISLAPSIVDIYEAGLSKE